MFKFCDIFGVLFRVSFLSRKMALHLSVIWIKKLIDVEDLEIWHPNGSDACVPVNVLIEVVFYIYYI